MSIIYESKLGQLYCLWPNNYNVSTHKVYCVACSNTDMCWLGITPKTRMLRFVLINSVILNFFTCSDLRSVVPVSLGSRDIKLRKRRSGSTGFSRRERWWTGAECLRQIIPILWSQLSTLCMGFCNAHVPQRSETISCASCRLQRVTVNADSLHVTTGNPNFWNFFFFFSFFFYWAERLPCDISR